MLQYILASPIIIIILMIVVFSVKDIRNLLKSLKDLDETLEEHIRDTSDRILYRGNIHQQTFINAAKAKDILEKLKTEHKR